MYVVCSVLRCTASPTGHRRFDLIFLHGQCEGGSTFAFAIVFQPGGMSLLASKQSSALMAGQQLYKAAGRGDEAKTRRLLREGADANWANRYVGTVCAWLSPLVAGAVLLPVVSHHGPIKQRALISPMYPGINKKPD